jgi:ribokinase
MITVIGSLNLDVFIEVTRFPRPGETRQGTNLRYTPGGKGANQALAAARLGARVTMIGAVGDDAFGEKMVANLAAATVETSGIVRRAETASGTAWIIVDDTGQNQIIVAPGANDTLSANDVRRHEDLIRRSTAVIAQLETPLETVESAFALAHEAGALAVLNPAPVRELKEELLHRCDWIIPNETEAEQLGGVEVRDLAGAAASAQSLQSKWGVPNIVITLGAAGAWVSSSSFTGHIPAPRVQAVDTVGAGDTFVGAFVTRLVEGAAVRDAARLACAAAALATTRRGAQAGIPTRAEAEAFLQ